MRRIVRILVSNWPLKLAAIGLATVLYAGVVLSQNVQAFDGQIPIEPLNLPTDAVLVDPLPAVTDIRYIAPTSVAGRVPRQNFSATVDFKGVRPTTSNPIVSVAVDLHSADGRVQILTFQPQTIAVRLDPLTHKTVPVGVDYGTVPAGLQVSKPVTSVSEVTVSGADSAVRRVTRALARVVIQPSALDVHEDVPLVGLDALGNVVEQVELVPAIAHVDIAVTSQATSKTVPVNPVLSGSAANGYAIRSVTVTPAIVTLTGDADALAGIERIDTAPISVAGAAANSTSSVGLALPEGVGSVSGTDVTVTIRVSAITETRAFSAGLVLAGARDDRVYSLSADRVIVTLRGPVASLDRLATDGLTAGIDVSGLGVGDHSVAARVNVAASLSIVSISPGSVVVGVTVVPPGPTPTPASSVGPSVSSGP